MLLATHLRTPQDGDLRPERWRHRGRDGDDGEGLALVALVSTDGGHGFFARDSEESGSCGLPRVLPGGERCEELGRNLV